MRFVWVNLTLCGVLPLEQRSFSTTACHYYCVASVVPSTYLFHWAYNFDVCEVHSCCSGKRPKGNFNHYGRWVHAHAISLSASQRRAINSNHTISTTSHTSGFEVAPVFFLFVSQILHSEKSLSYCNQWIMQNPPLGQACHFHPSGGSTNLLQNIDTAISQICTALEGLPSSSARRFVWFETNLIRTSLTSAQWNIRWRHSADSDTWFEPCPCEDRVSIRAKSRGRHRHIVKFNTLVPLVP